MQPSRPYITKRSESDMLALAPVRVRLGKEDYEIPILNNRKSQAWREKLFTALAPIVAGFDFGAIDLNSRHEQISQAMSSKLSQELIQFPEKLLDLLCEFAGEALSKEKIADEATDEQIALAFSQIAEVGYPFFFHLWATKRALAIQIPATPTTSTALQ